MKPKFFLGMMVFWFGLLSLTGIFLLESAAKEKHNSSQFTLAILEYPNSNWNTRPKALGPFLNYVEMRTSLETNSTIVSVSTESKDIFSYPMIIWIGDRKFSPLSDKAIANLQDYLRFGGFLLIDDSQGSPGYGFDLSVRREIKRLFPDQSLSALSQDHTIFRSFYLLEEAVGRVASSSKLYGIDVQDRTVLVYSQNDLLGAWSRDAFGNWQYQCTPRGERQRKKAYRLGVNILMYALCGDYKKDALHVEYILKRRRLP